MRKKCRLQLPRFKLLVLCDQQFTKRTLNPCIVWHILLENATSIKIVYNTVGRINDAVTSYLSLIKYLCAKNVSIRMTIIIILVSIFKSHHRYHPCSYVSYILVKAHWD